MWMYPALALWRPDFMSKMLQYRVDRLPGARANAKVYGMRGAKIPVMTCGSGAEATSSNGNATILGRNEIHESGDVVFEAQQHWRLSGAHNLSWVDAVGLPLASQVADYYASRASVRPGAGAQLHMDSVCGPDEHNAAVNDSGYELRVTMITTLGLTEIYLRFSIPLLLLMLTRRSRYIIASTVTSLNFAIELAELKAATTSSVADTSSLYNVSGWKDVVRRLAPSLPYDTSRNFHPEFEHMPMADFQAKQADTLMMQYPLMFNHSTMTPEAKLNDLLYYAKHSLISPDMTQAIYCIVALELNQTSLASDLFDLSYKRFNFPPYYTWSEKADGTGNVPYLTSGGGFLQTLQYGYVGVRALPGRLRLRPQLPVNVTAMALRRIAYCRERIDVEINVSVATVRPAAAGGQTRLRLTMTAGAAGAAASSGQGMALPATFPTGREVFVLCPLGSKL
jgi:trehalose/maltose hydrolase-like predicted phosphorylase